MAWPPETTSYCSWEEVSVSDEKGRREVHYYLKRRDGGADLAVVGKEKSLRYMSYKYALKNYKRSGLYKLKCRRDVIGWLDSIVSDVLPQRSDNLVRGSMVPKAAEGLVFETFEDGQLKEQARCTKVLWMGSSWMCRRRWKHYLSFCRNGVRISVNDFVYVLDEEKKRFIAYLEDMYEDARGSKMVVVRWFHKIDEVGIVLPHNVNDKEIFFSLCLQDINIECIDGLATVLSPQHYEKLQEQRKHFQLDSFFCGNIFDDDGVKPYDVTQLKGYWKQELLRHIYPAIAKDETSGQQTNADLRKRGTPDGSSVECRPKKRLHLSKDNVTFFHSAPVELLDAPYTDDQKFDCKSNHDQLDLGVSASPAPWKESNKISSRYNMKDLLVEVLSQDSGIRGCWFRALIIKKHKNKVKVQYQDIQDAEDEAKKLEEWILESRLAASDHLGIRISGRKMIRPPPETSKSKVQWAVDVGAIVDVWWHDGWWEGIVVQKESDNKFQVYLPGEKQMSLFRLGDLRHSQEWLGNTWVQIKPRPDLVSSILSSMGTKQVDVKLKDNDSAQVGIGDGEESGNTESGSNNSCPDSSKPTFLQPVPDLLKDVLLSKLKWKTTRKRRRGSVCSVHKLDLNNSVKSSPPVVVTSRALERSSLASGSFKVDCENCKYMGEPLFGSSVLPPLTSMVM